MRLSFRVIPARPRDERSTTHGPDTGCFRGRVGGVVGPASQADLGHHTGVDRSDIVATLNDLAERGLIERTPDPSDRRRNIVTITKAGTRHLDELERRIEGAQDELTAALTATERGELVRLLTRILDDHVQG
ncbi:MarR family winged helix-turn-helix transcriptional regulator [Nocardia sp. R16R-3T]